MDLNDNLKALFQQLDSFFHTEAVVGNPIVVGDVTLIPVVAVSFGAANGGVNGAKNEGYEGSGGGGGGRIEPQAMVVVRGNDVSVLPFNGQSPVDKILNVLPEIISRIKEKDD